MKKNNAIKVKYTPVKSKSRAGVEYVKYMLVIPANPYGFNYQARKELDAMEVKQKAGKKYYVKDGRGNRLYIKPKKNEKEK